MTWVILLTNSAKLNWDQKPSKPSVSNVHWSVRMGGSARCLQIVYFTLEYLRTGLCFFKPWFHSGPRGRQSHLTLIWSDLTLLWITAECAANPGGLLPYLQDFAYVFPRVILCTWIWSDAERLWLQCAKLLLHLDPIIESWGIICFCSSHKSPFLWTDRPVGERDKSSGAWSPRWLGRAAVAQELEWVVLHGRCFWRWMVGEMQSSELAETLFILSSSGSSCGFIWLSRDVVDHVF